MVGLSKCRFKDSKHPCQSVYRIVELGSEKVTFTQAGEVSRGYKASQTAGPLVSFRLALQQCDILEPMFAFVAGRYP